MSYHDLTKKTYNAIADDYSKRDFLTIEETADVRKMLDQFLSLLSPGSYVLDVGCGGGRDSRYLNEKGMRVIGVDFSEEMIRNAKELSSDVEYVLGDFEHLDFPEHTFDAVWANASLHHIPKDRLLAVLKNLHTFLKSGGVMAVKVKHGTFDGIQEARKFDKDIARYFSFYLPQEFLDIAQAAGFSVVDHHITNSGEWLGVILRK